MLPGRERGTDERRHSIAARRRRRARFVGVRPAAVGSGRRRMLPGERLELIDAGVPAVEEPHLLVAVA